MWKTKKMIYICSEIKRNNGTLFLNNLHFITYLENEMVKKTGNPIDDKKTKLSQADFPGTALGDAVKIAQGLWDNFAGKSAAPHDVAFALDISPTSSSWRTLCGSAVAYGLTDGGYAAPQIVLSELGRRIVAPIEDGDDSSAERDAVLRPRIMGEFFKRYDRAKFPKDDIAVNVLVNMGLPKDRAASALSVLKENGKRVGIIRETKTGPYVAISGGAVNVSASEQALEVRSNGLQDEEEVQHGENTPLLKTKANTVGVASSRDLNNKVFITHGKNTKIMEQIKKLVALGGFEPVVSIQRETTAKPVPEKVMDDMRSCGAAVINVALEGAIKDTEGNEHPQLNPNVLIEIGAAMALYRGRFILVVEDGAKLPSNLQGLYVCRYQGDGLDMDAGMKILEALRGLK